MMPVLGLILTLIPLVASGGSPSAEPAHKPYTLMIRYGSLPGAPPTPTALPGTPAQPGKAFLRAAHRLDISVATVDTGHVATRGAALSYRIDASRKAAAVDVALTLTYALDADSRSTLTTHLRVPRNEWVPVSGSLGASTAGTRSDSVYVRIAPH